MPRSSPITTARARQLSSAATGRGGTELPIELHLQIDLQLHIRGMLGAEAHGRRAVGRAVALGPATPVDLPEVLGERRVEREVPERAAAGRAETLERSAA